MHSTSKIIFLILMLNVSIFFARSTRHTVKLPCSKCNELLKSTSSVLSEWFIQEQKKDPTLHIMQAYRNEKEQKRALKSGASTVGWGKSAHNYLPSLAMDLFFLENGKSKQIPAKYKKMLRDLPPTIENGSIIPGLVDWDHFQIKNWQELASNYPYGNV